MQVAMLGPLEVRADDSGAVLEVGGARLRRALPGAVIESRPAGYQLTSTRSSSRTWPPLIPRCELVTIPAGHLVHAARPADFTDAVTAFLGRPS